MKDGETIRVFFVDDHFIAREGLRSIIASEQGLSVVGEASTGEEAIEMFPRLEPDVTLMDVRLPGKNGLDVITEIRRTYPQSRFVVLTSHDGDELIHRALGAGVQGYLYKDMVRAELTTAIRVVHSGRKYIPVPVSSRLYETSPRASITAREIDVIRLVAKGMANKEIAQELQITEFTVKAHIQSILSKLGASDRTHAVMIAMQRGLLLL